MSSKNPISVGFDIDDTLWKCRRYEDRRLRDQVPDYALINVLLWFANNGDKVYVWSAGGIDYAQTIVNKLGLDEFVTVISKSAAFGMDISFDDMAVHLAKVNVQVHRDYVPED